MFVRLLLPPHTHNLEFVPMSFENNKLIQSVLFTVTTWLQNLQIVGICEYLIEKYLNDEINIAIWKGVSPFCQR